jgi:dipeptidyl aminopeptidase/acylaminoacyl peptidase
MSILGAEVTDASFTTVIVSWLTIGSKVVGGIVLTLLAILYSNQEKMLYMPNPPGFPRTPHENPAGYQSPATWSTNGRMINPAATNVQDRIEFEEHFVKTDDGINLHTWLLLQPDSENVPTLIYFHGNAGNMGFLLKNAALMFALAKINILLMDYRGYGEHPDHYEGYV